MTTHANAKQERQYYIDWLRILLIISVFLFHIGMVFNTWDWHVKNSQLYGGMLTGIMTFLHSWRMPLLFLLSGAGTYFALGKRTPGQYLSERFRRLFIPLVAGIFILVPVQVYIEKASVYGSLLDFYPHMFEGIYPEGNFSWHHLWFIAYLFVIALFISPFLGLLRSEKFAEFTRRINGIVTKPLALNIFIIPILLSQIVLRTYFEFGTNALVNDWASMSFYIIFFLAGFILLPDKNIADAIRRQRLLYLAETIILTVIMFRVPGFFESERTGEIIWDVTSLFLAWACGITAVGFAKQYLNFDSGFRKLANEAIFPFYLLHQPVIVVVGYFIIHWDIAVLWKVLLITIISLAIITCLYMLVIRRVNFLRVIFGMKMVRNEKNESVAGLVLIPVIAKTTANIQK
jgi:peptidoglycan/LPS O-acetylase OafA/YrhL